MPPASDALRRAAAAGPFFTVDLQPEAVAWQPFSTLLDPYSGALKVAIGTARESLSARSGTAVEDRVAASLWFLGWSARLVSPWLGAAVTGGVVPVVGPDALRWQAVAGQPVPLGAAEPEGHAVDPADPVATAEALYAACLDPLVEPLLEAVADAVPVSRRVLWGNVGSAVAGAAGQLARAAGLRALGGSSGPSARSVAETLLTTGVLQGQGAYSGSGFARRTCCLLYRLPGSPLCADCVLVRR